MSTVEFGKDAASSFTELAKSYDRFAGTCIRSVSGYAVSILPHPLQPNARVLDNACGTGLLTRELLKKYPDVNVDAVDLAPGMIQGVHSLIQNRHWEGKVEATVMNGLDLKFPDNRFDASFTMFAIFFLGEKGAKEIYRTLRTGGVAVVSTWEYVGWMPILHEVQKIAKPGQELLVIPLMEEWKGKEILVETLQKGGFEEVQVLQRKSLATAENDEELADLLIGAFSSMTKQVWGEEGMNGMKEPLQEVLKTQREKWVVEEDGKVGIRMNAWVAIATK